MENVSVLALRLRKATEKPCVDDVGLFYLRGNYAKVLNLSTRGYHRAYVEKDLRIGDLFVCIIQS